ncbi:hypothetical protein QQF64_023741 [Cirrhinus molitorella]|uniref:ribonuclease H n=1 Tax=Cirrhinus molitorella TaxID=172907 RepID=A0ABR3NJ95_9TELE
METPPTTKTAAVDPFAELVHALRRALQWADGLWTSKSPALATITSFFTHFKQVFGTGTHQSLLFRDELIHLRQGDLSIHDYTLRFRSLAATSGWNEIALLAAYRKGLHPEIRRQMVIYDDNSNIETFVQKAIHVSQHLSACSVPTNQFPVRTERNSESKRLDEPMITDHYHLHSSERQRRLKRGLCLYCGGADHIIAACPIRPPKTMVSAVRLTPNTSHIPHFIAQLKINRHFFPVSVLVDSGAAGNFVSSHFVDRHNLRTVPSETSYQITTIQGTPLGNGKITRRTPTWELTVHRQHKEKLTFLILPNSIVDVILGRPWLAHHQPHMDWKTGKVLEWNESCQHRCLQKEGERLPLQSTTIESPNTTITVTIPPAYHTYHDVFKGWRLRPRIDYRVLNEATVKFAYPLPLVPAALEELREACIFSKLDLRSAYNLIRIREGDEWKTAFVTPTGHYEYRFVIVYIDDILIYSRNVEEHQNHVCKVLNRLRQHQLYLKTEKCEFHVTTVSFLGYVISAEGVKMEPGKVDAVRSGLHLQRLKNCKRFLGFANFYRRFIKNYSLCASPLTSLLKGGKKKLDWSQPAQEAFERLKEKFTTAPILSHPNPNFPSQWK